MTRSKRITIEGLSPEEILALPDDEIDQLVFCDEPLIFRAGTADLFGKFKIKPETLVVELAQIDGGGEGVLLMLWTLAERIAAKRGLHKVEWIVHAVSCAKPNMKLRQVLERKGFRIEEVPGVGEAFHYLHRVGEAKV